MNNRIKGARARLESALGKGSLRESSLWLDVRYREKRYENSPADEYDQIRINPGFVVGKEGPFRISVTGGIRHENYVEADEKDRLGLFARIEEKGELFGKRVFFKAFLRSETLRERRETRRTNREEGGGVLEYRKGPWWFRSVSLEGLWGERETKDEDRDDDFDFDFWRVSVRTKHRILPGLRITARFRHFEKDYASRLLDHHGFSVETRWRWEPVRDSSQLCWLRCAAAHKELNYPDASHRNYRKETLESALGYRRTKQWKSLLLFRWDSYDYSAEGKDKNRYVVELVEEKYFLDGDLILGLRLKQRWTESGRVDDARQESVRLELRYRGG